MIWYRFKTFFTYLLHSKNQHAVHSPFIYDVITKCLYSKTPKLISKQLCKYRKPVLKSQKVIEMTDIGEGSKNFTSMERKVSAIARKAGMGWHQSHLMNKIVSYFNIKDTLELGTSVGLGSLAMAIKQPQNRVDTVEACPKTATYARGYFKSKDLKHIRVYNTSFQSYIEQLSSEKTYDLIYLDGHHDKEATLYYFQLLKKHIHHNSIMILDDIYWSKAMQEAWLTILKDEHVKVGIDLYFWGILFFKPELSKQNFKIRCLL